MSSKKIIPRTYSYPANLVFAADWIEGDPYRSQVFNAISMSFPAGEKWVIDTVRRAVETIDGDAKAQWAAAARDFMAQESSHSAIHRKYNQQLFRHGLVNWWEKKLLAQIAWGEKGTPLNQLASSVAYEYLTACFSSALMRGNSWLDGAHPELARIWYWHASEELEHKHFVFDLYRAIGGGPVRRILWFVWAAPRFIYQFQVQVLLNLYRTGSLFKLRTFIQGMKYNFGRYGIAWVTLAASIRFLNPFFSIKDGDADKFAASWLRQAGDLLREMRQRPNASCEEAQ